MCLRHKPARSAGAGGVGHLCLELKPLFIGDVITDVCGRVPRAAVVAGIWGVSAERKSLEDVARPLSSADE